MAAKKNAISSREKSKRVQSAMKAEHWLRREGLTMPMHFFSILQMLKLFLEIISAGRVFLVHIGVKKMLTAGSWAQKVTVSHHRTQCTTSKSRCSQGEMCSSWLATLTVTLQRRCSLANSLKKNVVALVSFASRRECMHDESLKPLMW